MDNEYSVHMHYRIPFTCKERQDMECADKWMNDINNAQKDKRDLSSVIRGS